MNVTISIFKDSNQREYGVYIDGKLFIQNPYLDHVNFYQILEKLGHEVNFHTNVDNKFYQSLEQMKQK